MKRIPLNTYDDRPDDMKNYLKYYGQHFNKKLCDFAISKMDHGKTPIKKEQIDQILSTYKVELKNNELYDYVYVYNMGNNDFLGSSIPDDKHLVLYVKDVIDDKDGYDGIVFNRWYADTVACGIPIEWDDML
jgi:hypothetical protein